MRYRTITTQTFEPGREAFRMTRAPKIFATQVPKVGDIVELETGFRRVGLVLDHIESEIFDREDGRPMSVEMYQVLIGTEKRWVKPGDICVV